jgi:hypothetical protein
MLLSFFLGSFHAHDIIYAFYIMEWEKCHDLICILFYDE